MKNIYLAICTLFLLLSCNSQKKQNENGSATLSDTELFEMVLDSQDFKEELNNLLFVQQNIKLAEAGVISDREIIQMYNSLLGSVMGKKDNFIDIERTVRHNQEDYKQYILYDLHTKYSDDSLQIAKYTSERDKYLKRMRE